MRRLPLSLLLLCPLALGLAGCAPEEPSGQQPGTARGLAEPAPATSSPSARPGTPAEVIDVVDGDTIHARLRSGRVERVRLIGIDAPERSTTRTGYPQCGGEEATEALERLAPRRSEIRLTTDAVQDRRDRFGRLLAYVRTAESGSATLQELLLRAGWARVYVYDRRPFTKVSRFRAAAAAAREAGRGVWRACGGDFRRPAD